MALPEDSMHFLRRRSFRDEEAARRRLSIALFAVVFGFFAYVVIVLLPPAAGILRRHEQILAAQAEGMKKIPNLEATIRKLEEQQSLLSTTSIEARIDAIEKAIQAGRIKPDQVATLLDVKRDIEVLKTYMFRDPRELVELKELQNNYRVLNDAVSAAATREMVRAEIGTLQMLFGVSLAFFGLLFSVLFGSWWFIGRKSTSEAPTTPVQPPKQGGTP